MTDRDGATLDLLVHGLPIRIAGDWPEVTELLRLDFGWFAVPSAAAARPGVELTPRRRAPDYAPFASAEPVLVTPRNVVFEHDGEVILDYGGHALAAHDREGDRLTIEGEDAHLVHEAAFQFVLSRIGRHLDARGTPRVHALGVSGPTGATLVMLPSGGGKTSLALRALADPRVRLLAEDTPLLDRRGRVHPFPLRLGVNEQDASLLPEGVAPRLVPRMEFHPKLIVPVDSLAERFEASARPLNHLVVGRRTLARESVLRPASKAVAVGPLVREAVFGVGVYQGMEFLLQRGAGDVARHSGVALRRAAICAAGLANANVWQLELGRDGGLAWRELADLVTGHRNGPGRR